MAKNIENEIAIAQGRRRMLAFAAHLPHGFWGTHAVADRAQQRRRTERELVTGARARQGRGTYGEAQVMNLPAPLQNCDGRLVSRLNLQWHNHVLHSATHFNAPA